MQKVYSVNCGHVYAQRSTPESQHTRFLVSSDRGEVNFQKDWRFCPLCGKEVLFNTAEK